MVEVNYARLRWAAQVARRRRRPTVPLESVDDEAAASDGDSSGDDLAGMFLEPSAPGGSAGATRP